MGDPKVNCKAFWSLYEEQHPGHQVFQKHGQRLERVLPIMLHGDEGKAGQTDQLLRYGPWRVSWAQDLTRHSDAIAASN